MATATQAVWICLAIAGGILCLTLPDPVLLTAVVLTVALVMSTVLGVVSLCGWQHGVIESLVISSGVGLSIDQAAHIALAHEHLAHGRQRHGALGEATVKKVGPPLFAAALSTGLMALLMCLGGTVISRRLGFFIGLVTCVSWLFGFFFLVPLLNACHLLGALGACELGGLVAMAGRLTSRAVRRVLLCLPPPHRLASLGVALGLAWLGVPIIAEFIAGGASGEGVGCRSGWRSLLRCPPEAPPLGCAGAAEDRLPLAFCSTVGAPTSASPRQRVTCDELHGRTRVACEVQHRPGKRERHLGRMAACRWRQEPRVVHRFHKLSNPPEAARSEACVLQEASSGSSWLFVKTGPVLTTGGYSWDNLFSRFEDEMLSPWQRRDGALWVAGHVLGSTDAAGALFDNPPLHHHHFHLYHGGNPSRMTLNNHGDSNCDPSHEGVYCQLFEFPAGVAFLLRPQLGMFAHLNDLRTRGSPALESYYFAGLELLPARASPRPVIQRMVGVWPSVWPFVQRPFPVDSSREAVIFTPFLLEGVDAVLTAWFHMHRDAVDAAWLLAGSRSQLGLDVAPWAAAEHAFYYAPSVIGRLKAHLQRALRKGGSSTRLLCHTGEEVDFTDGTRRWCLFDPPPQPQLILVAFFRARRPETPNPYRTHLLVYVDITTRSNMSTTPLDPYGHDALPACVSDTATLEDLCAFYDSIRVEDLQAQHVARTSQLPFVG